MAEYINQELVTLNDLVGLDAKISEVEHLISETNDQVQSKAHNLASPAANIENSKLTELIGEVIEKISVLREKEPEKALAMLKELDEKFPNLAVVQGLTRLYSQAKQQQAVDIYLERALAIETELSELSETSDSITITKLSEIFNKIQSADTSDVPPDVLEEVTNSLRGDALFKIDLLKSKLTNSLNEQLTHLKWMGASFVPRSLTDKQISDLNNSIGNLVKLQAIVKTPTYPETWWAVDILLAPVVDRFNFHFNSKNKETNKLAKPEWAFSFIEDFLTKNLKYLELAIADAFSGIEPIMIYEVITSLLVPVRTKINSMVHTLNDSISNFQDDTRNLEKSGRLLTHLIYEVSSFDQRLRNTYKYNPYLKSIADLPDKKWKGLIGDVLLGQDDNERVAATNWLDFELKLALNRFHTEIASDKNSLTIDMDLKIDGADSKPIRPTHSAYNLVKLFDNLTTHYKTLSIVKFQLKYASTIQLKLLDLYLDFLKQQFKLYEDKYGAAVLNILPGRMESSQTSDISIQSHLKGLEMLTQILCSARFISQSLQAWSEELIFLQLWRSYREFSVKKYDSDATIFDSHVEKYDAFVNAIRHKLDDFFKKIIKNYLKSYVNTTQWELQETKSNTTYFSQLVVSLPAFLNYLNKVLSGLDYFIVADSVVGDICQLWHEYIITNNRFNRMGAEQLRVDFVFLLDQFSSELFLDKESDIHSTKSNVYYQKVLQSIDILTKFDSVIARNIAKYYHEREVREEFSHGLSALSNHEIKDILLRIG